MAQKKIMLVDDDLEFLKELQETLNLSGYEIIPIHNSKTAVYAATTMKPDLILLDLKMDGVDGFQVAQEIKRLPETSKIPIIAMTGYFTSQEHTEVIDRCGMHTCLKKPFNPLDLISRIENVMSESNKPESNKKA